MYSMKLKTHYTMKIASVLTELSLIDEQTIVFSSF